MLLWIALEEVVEMAAKKRKPGNTGSATAAEKRVMDKKKLSQNYSSTQNAIAEFGMQSPFPSVQDLSVRLYKKYNVKSDKEITPQKYKALLKDLKGLGVASDKVRQKRGR